MPEHTTSIGDLTIAQRHTALAEEFTRRVEQVPDGAWDNDSPCAGWTARDVLRHMLDNYANMPSHAGISLTIDGSVVDDPVGTWIAAQEKMGDLLADPERAGAEYDGYFGRTSIQATVDTFLGVDLVAHAWDIARATGQDEQLPAEHCRHYYELMLPFQDNLRMEGVCGPAVAVPDDAPIQHRFLGLLGRTP
ncbi:uncharacterized protein (TIGR03086 family) [Tamaricihabitans halophyticus]|uniref:Uncharacterized protein (TIGR03086 family) n=1 Tax=Tamaricihabitans halophyticus TaxID=1262583 RepID=A0A4R2QQN8_9PSEU|nr:TIGR03086 family metal-binding protein [Tamaricihabitans halophyticus]TCP52072.1 uncharacterized protein (TIGR03086 family) [Tamaricihabitans halophyticus]